MGQCWRGVSDNKMKSSCTFLLVCISLVMGEADPWSTGYTTIGYGGYGGYGGLGYAGYGGNGLGYGGYGGYGYGGYGGGYGTVGIARGYGGYAGAGTYVAANPGAIHIAKRSAQPEAEPQYAAGYSGLGGYSSLGYTLPAYSALGYTGYTGGYGLYNGYGGYSGLYGGAYYG